MASGNVNILKKEKKRRSEKKETLNVTYHVTSDVDG